MKTYPVLTAIEYGTTAKNVKRYEVGDTIDLEEATSVQLLELGAIGPALEPEVEATGKAKK